MRVGSRNPNSSSQSTQPSSKVISKQVGRLSCLSMFKPLLRQQPLFVFGSRARVRFVAFCPNLMFKLVGVALCTWVHLVSSYSGRFPQIAESYRGSNV